MVTPRHSAWAGLAVAASLSCAPVAAAGAVPGAPTVSKHVLLHSRELWATIDVCGPAGQPDTVGVRGSMPGDGSAADRMYMSFRLQYMAADKRWTDAKGASSGWEPVGDGSSPRQGGTSFGLKAPARGKPALTLRGVVDFQWRAGAKVLVSAAELTTAGHKSLAGADPAGYSAASCVIR